MLLPLRLVIVGFLFAVEARLAPIEADPRASVGDLVNCLGNQTRFVIHPHALGIFVQSTPYSCTAAGWFDDAVTDCISSLNMTGAQAAIVPLDVLQPTNTSLSTNSVLVPLEFVPEPGCPESSYEDRGSTLNATVHDLVECLGNTTRYRIQEEGRGSLFVETTPFNYDELVEESDGGLWDCLNSLRMWDVTTQIVSLERLRAINTVLVPLDFVPRSSDADLSHDETGTASRATVRDLVGCLGLGSHYTIHPDGAGIFVQSHPYGWMPTEDEDLDVSDCVLELGMDGVRQQVVRLEMLRQADASQGDRYVEVPLDFVPKEDNQYAWRDYETQTYRRPGAQSKDGGIVDPAAEGQLPLSPTVVA
ncbi:hypothetical protein PSEUBRA_001430 [Kalmanozyma brasiliensis GHG001]|uniref:uncharacterized protein n=1 Tax=Kalmanozyma brasiliensis (strain GHG001) TaxID=1365824 RepID=UPI002867DF95|nr:uncharacterized protein PSEUBRA_001430 [Kalmanozyma brasiliensis GHG001]KAF6766941.1 hypothetical protein PSEUBRA_001430 [Kalmanozyma brasiliensis GHG001]